MESGPPYGLRPEHLLVTPLATLAETVSAEVVGAPSVEVTGIEQRSAAVLPGDLFVGLPGARAHGARFAAQAIASGAVAVLTDSAGVELLAEERIVVPLLIHPDPRAVLGRLSATIYGMPSQRLQVVGITGTSGKTTTAYLVEAGLAASGRTTAVIGTIGTRIAGRSVPSALTTPEAPQLHAMFAAMLEQGVDAVVMEVSSHALALGRVDGIRFDVGAFTNLSQDHFDFHNGFEDYFAAKAKLFDRAVPGHAETAVICVDDDWGGRMAELVGAGAITVSTTEAIAEAAIWTAEQIRVESDGTQRFTATGPDGSLSVSLRLPGRYNVANAMLALVSCVATGVDARTVATALSEVEVPGRLQRIDRGQNFLAVVDYAHKPAALAAVIETLRAQTPTDGRIAVVVGAGGDRDAAKRPLMGEVVARAADLLIITDDNPRSEDPASIRAALARGAAAVTETERGEVRVIGDRAAAIAVAVEWAGPSDVVLVAGKGHEAGQEIHGVKHPFDDAVVLADVLDRKKAGKVSS